MKICFFGSYDKTYSRNISVMAAMESANFEIINCHVSSKTNFVFRFFQLIFQGLKLDFDILWVGFPGHLETLPAKIICVLKRKPLVSDIFISKYDSEREYNLIKNKHSLRAKFLRFIDKSACLISDKVFLDTPQHINFFISEYNLPKDKFDWLFVGTNEKLFHPVDHKLSDSEFKVLFYGRVTPFHGFQYILDAARKLMIDKQIKFRFIGSNMYFRDLRDKYASLPNCSFDDEIKLEQLPHEIANSDVCLGAFGTSPKIDRVIMNKIFEPISMKKPVITAKSDALKGIFTNMKNIILVNRGDSDEIKNAILLLKHNKILRKNVSENGYLLFNEKFSSAVLGKKLKQSLNTLLDN